MLRGEVPSADPVENTAIKFSVSPPTDKCFVENAKTAAKNGSLLNKDRKVHIFVKTLIRSL